MPSLATLSLAAAALFAVGGSAIPHGKSSSTSATSTATATGTGTSRPSATGLAADLDPSCAPGGNFDLSKWSLQLPTGREGHPDTIAADQLQGCGGYQDAGHRVFFTESGDGALVMKVPGSPDAAGCVTTAHSQHCRTELRESHPSSWDPNADHNRLAVTLAVRQPDDSKYGTVVGQIHIDDSISTKPVCELYYNKEGTLTMGVERTRDGGNSVFTEVGQVDVGETFSYLITYENGELAVAINDGAAKKLDTYELDSPKSYFKAGNYNQGNSASDVHFFAIDVEH